MRDGNWSRRRLFRCCGTVAAAGLGGLSSVVDADAKTLSNVERFVSRPDLRPPRIDVGQRGRADGPAHVLLSANGPVGQGGLVMLNRRGDLVWFRPVAPGGVTKNLNVQTYRGKPVLTWWESGRGNGDPSIGNGNAYIADGSYNIVATVRAGNGLLADFHEFCLTDRGTALITAFRHRTTDLSRLGGSSRGVAFAGVAQEIDVATGKVVFEWDSLEHVPVTETLHHFYPGTHGRPFDYFHINSVSVADDGDLLISARNTCAVYKVDRDSGAVQWRLGGRKSDFAMGRGAAFWWQHHARAHGSGVLSLFDDGAEPARERESRGILLDLDTAKRRCSLRRAFQSPDRWEAVNQGSMQLLPDGGAFIGWGSQPYFSQFTAAGKQVLTGRFPRGDWSYRAFTADWTGTPGGRPAVVARRCATGTVVYVSWNGATEVARWEVSAGNWPSSLRVAGSQPSSSFETAVYVRDHGPYFSVAACDAHGRVLGRSGVVRCSR
jgi:hypothetical protein